MLNSEHKMLDAKIDNPCFTVNYIEYFNLARRLNSYLYFFFHRLLLPEFQIINF